MSPTITHTKHTAMPRFLLSAAKILFANYRSPLCLLASTQPSAIVVLNIIMYIYLNMYRPKTFSLSSKCKSIIGNRLRYAKVYLFPSRNHWLICTDVPVVHIFFPFYFYNLQCTTSSTRSTTPSVVPRRTRQRANKLFVFRVLHDFETSNNHTNKFFFFCLYIYYVF